MTAQGGRLFLQFAFTIQIIGKRFPLLDSLVAIVLRQFLVNDIAKLAMAIATVQKLLLLLIILLFKDVSLLI